MTTPPQNLDAEESVLGAMLLSPKAIERVEGEVTAGEFYRPSHGLIFTVALELHAKGEPVDAITVCAELERRQKLDEVGGKTRINELAALVPSPSSAGHHAKVVRELSRRRSVLAAGQTIADAATTYAGTAEELTQYAEQTLASASLTSHSGDFQLLASGVDVLMGRIGEAVESGKPIFGALTGFIELDKMLSGLHPGQLIVLAARPGVGKSVFAQNIAENLASRGQPTAFFSLEMTKEELQLRSLCRQSKLDLRRLRTGQITKTEYESLVTISNSLALRPFYVEPDPSIRPTELRARARRLKQRHGLGLLVVDYLQLMVPEEAKNKKNDEIAAISRSLKLLAKELEVPIIAVSQLNRNTEYRADKRPTLADLRDSGAIEQDADVVLFLYREETYTQVEAAQAGDAEVIVAKNRMGEQGTVKLLFLGRRQAFANPAREAESAAA